jgi:hypothetical protein
LPLFYAEETLPERITQKRQLDSYVAKALEKVQQGAEKNEKKDSMTDDQDEIKPEETTQEPVEDEEARKLAEKYY